MDEELQKAIEDLRGGKVKFPSSVREFLLRLDGESSNILDDISSRYGVSARDVLLLSLQWLNESLRGDISGAQED